MRGPASQSYGVAVAKLAGLPKAVLARANELLAGGAEGRWKQRFGTSIHEYADLRAFRKRPLPLGRYLGMRAAMLAREKIKESPKLEERYAKVRQRVLSRG